MPISERKALNDQVTADQVTADGDTGIHRFIDTHATELVTELSEWVRVRSVAGSGEQGNVAASAIWLANRFRSAGFPTVELLPTGDSFAVYAEWCAEPSAPTVLVYSHHDVRAVNESTWSLTDPFEPLLRGDRLYGRGSSDAKGQVMAHLWGVLAHLAATGRSWPALNLKFLIEGEEELGSPHLADLLHAEGNRLSADLIVFSDTLQWSLDEPALCTSVRGMVGARLTVRGPAQDVHSGAVSGSAPNPILELSGLVAALHDAEGRIALPGFYDGVEEPSDQRRRELAALVFDEDDWLRRSNTVRIVGEIGYSVLERLWVRPSLEIISVSGGDHDGVPRAVIPATAEAEISIRIVPNQTCRSVGAQLREFVASRFPDPSRYELQVTELTQQEPYVTPDQPGVEALSRAMARGHRVANVGRMGNAGGGPAELLSRVIGAPVIFYGTGLVEDNWHDGDESINVEMLKRGVATLAALWQELAA